MKGNLCRIDGVLLGAGCFTALFAVHFSFGIAHEIKDNVSSFSLLVALLLIVGRSLVMLVTGWRERRYETALVETWQLVARHNDVGITP